jgi:geranylgeranyldiphosphate transferase
LGVDLSFFHILFPLLTAALSWYCHLQNDCKNIYSANVITAKGVLAEDLKNGEYSFPVVLALYASPRASGIIKEALCGRGESVAARDKRIRAALTVLHSSEIKSACMAELELLKGKVSPFVITWGRQEKMDLGSSL